MLNKLLSQFKVFSLSLFAFYFLPWTEEHSTNQLELILIVIVSGMAILACTVAFAIVRRNKKAHQLRLVIFTFAC